MQDQHHIQRSGSSGNRTRHCWLHEVFPPHGAELFACKGEGADRRTAGVCLGWSQKAG